MQTKQENHENQEAHEDKQDIPFLLTQESFNQNKNEQKHQELLRQRQMMQSSAQSGRQLLIAKQYLNASKQLSKTVMAFQYILKTHMSIIPKQQIKQMLIKTVVPCYNNLALCHLKLKNPEMVVTFSNQVIGQDPDNVKARHRRAMAYKQLKRYDQAIQDLNIAKKLDPELTEMFENQQQQCKRLETEEKKLRKARAQKFISGYQGQQRSNEEQLRKKQTAQKKIQQHQQNLQKPSQTTTNNSKSILSWIRQTCSKLTNIFKVKQHSK